MRSKISIYGDKAENLKLLNTYYSSPVKKDALTLQTVETHYIENIEDEKDQRIINKLLSSNQLFIFRSSFIGEDDPGYAGYAQSIQVTNTHSWINDARQIIKSYPTGSMSKSLVIQPYIQPKVRSSGVISFDKHTQIMEVHSMDQVGCEEVVDGTLPSCLSVFDGSHLISNAQQHLNKEMIHDLYMALLEIVKKQNTSIQVEYVMDMEKHVLYFLQLKPLTSTYADSSYLTPEGLPTLEKDHQNIVVQTIVPGQNIVLNTRCVFLFENIDDAHTHLIQNKSKNSLYIIYTKTSCSMGSHYATNFQALGCTLMYTPHSAELLKKHQENNAIFVCSPQQQKLFVLNDTLDLASHIRPGIVCYPISAKPNFEIHLDPLKKDNLLAHSIADFIELQSKKKAEIIRVLHNSLTQEDLPRWIQKFEENQDVRNFLFLLYHYDLLSTCLFLFDHNSIESSIDPFKKEMKQLFVFLEIIHYCNGLFQYHENAAQLEKSYAKFNRICNRLNEFLLDKTRFTYYYPSSSKQNKTVSPLESYIYSNVLFKAYIEFMDQALKSISCNPIRETSRGYMVFCKMLHNFFVPYQVINKIATGWSFSPFEEALFNAANGKINEEINDICAQYNYSEQNTIDQIRKLKDQERKINPEEMICLNRLVKQLTAAQLWTMQHAVYQKELFDLACERYLYNNNNYKNIHLSQEAKDKLCQIPACFFSGVSFSKEQARNLMLSPLSHVCDIEIEGHFIFLIIRIAKYSHSYEMVIPLSMQGHIQDVYFIVHTCMHSFTQKEMDFAEKNRWCVLGDSKNNFNLQRIIKHVVAGKRLESTFSFSWSVSSENKHPENKEEIALTKSRDNEPVSVASANKDPGNKEEITFRENQGNQAVLIAQTEAKNQATTRAGKNQFAAVQQKLDNFLRKEDEFDKELKKIQKRYKGQDEEIARYSLKFNKAKKAVRTIHDQLTVLISQYQNGELKIEACKKHVQEVLHADSDEIKTLKEHRGMKQKIVDLLTAFLLGLGIIYRLTTGKWTMFPTQTDTCQRLKKLEQDLLRLP